MFFPDRHPRGAYRPGLIPLLTCAVVRCLRVFFFKLCLTRYTPCSCWLLASYLTVHVFFTIAFFCFFPYIPFVLFFSLPSVVQSIKFDIYKRCGSLQGAVEDQIGFSSLTMIAWSVFTLPANSEVSATFCCTELTICQFQKGH